MRRDRGSIMRKRHMECLRSLGRYGWYLVGIAIVITSLSAGWASPASGATHQRRFASVEEAASALVDALRSGDRKALVSILGDEGKALVSSGDEVSDRRSRERFVAAYDEKHQFEAGGGKVVLV